MGWWQTGSLRGVGGHDEEQVVQYSAAVRETDKEARRACWLPLPPKESCTGWWIVWKLCGPAPKSRTNLL